MNEEIQVEPDEADVTRLAIAQRDEAREQLAAVRADAEQARDALSAAMTESRQRCELLEEIGVMAANAPEDGDCFAVLEEIAMRAAAHGVPDEAHQEGGR